MTSRACCGPRNWGINFSQRPQLAGRFGKIFRQASARDCDSRKNTERELPAAAAAAANVDARRVSRLGTASAATHTEEAVKPENERSTCYRRDARQLYQCVADGAHIACFLVLALLCVDGAFLIAAVDSRIATDS